MYKGQDKRSGDVDMNVHSSKRQTGWLFLTIRI